jgi:hydroxyacylglutathione hydrolase
MKLINNLYFYPEQGMLDCNTYVFKGVPGIIIDPGNPDYLDTLVTAMEQDGIQPADISIIANTHLHIDHCGANEAFKKMSGASVALYPAQEKNYQLVVVDGARLFGMEPGEFTVDYILKDPFLKSGSFKIEIIPSPGHSPDSVCFYLRQEQVLVCGDVIFEMNTGRVDLPGGNADDLKNSIEALSKLDVGYLLPGHMGIITGAEKVRQNFEFVRSSVFQWL